MIRTLLNNFFHASIAAIIVALVHLIVWGEFIRDGAITWMVIFFVVFNVGDGILWAVRKYRV